MPIRFGSTELVIILVIVILLFGVGRIGKIAGELGSGISAFRKAINPDEKEKKKNKFYELTRQQNHLSD